MPSTVAKRSKFYYPELDGLRFIAFLLVFIHHAPVPDHRVWSFVHSFGWIGVDLFFALSAFLFVKLLAKEYDQTGTISIRKFYLRRGLRIWPIYATFCLFILATGSSSASAGFFSWRALGLFTFADNVLTACKGYDPIFGSAHLWTISYEEQFYLLIPLLLLFLFQSPRWRVVASLSGIAALFTLIRAGMIWQQAPHPAIWVLPVTHFESILLGIVVGLGGFDVILSRIPAILILAAGLFSGWLMTRMGSVQVIDWSLMVSYVLIGSCTSLIVYVVFRTGNSRFMKWLSLGPFVYLGRISYGLYLYHVLGLNLGSKFVHHPCFKARLPFSEPLTSFVASLCITVAIASVSYLLIEKPFLKLKKRYEIIASRPV